VLIPGLALLAMWALVSSYTLSDGIYTRNVASAVEQVDLPAVQTLSALQKERGLSMLAVRDPSYRPALAQQRKLTDMALVRMLHAADALRRESPRVVQDRMRAWETGLAGLPAGRARVDAGQLNRDATYAYYNGLVDAGISVFRTQAHNISDYVTGEAGLQAASLLQSGDRMERAADLVSDGLSGGDLGPPQHAEIARLIGSYHAIMDTTVPGAPDGVRQHYDQITRSGPYAHLTDLENQVINAGPWTQRGHPPAITARDWTGTANRVSDDLSGLATEQTNYAAERGLAHGEDNLTRVAFGSFAALLVTVLALFSAARVSRTIARRLGALRADALALSDERLPTIVEQLRRGERVEPGEEISGLDYGTDEIGQVAEAFNTAQRTAVAAAVQEAQAREGVHTVFLGIAHRSQGLVHRQLKLIDQLEHDTEDPDQMELLFQLDHLATRARRNAENLIILGGEQPGRRWTKPVRLVDVLRSAVAETKHYARVRMHQPPDAALNGSAVADTVHLIAELVDNATAFSPPNSEVRVGAQSVPQGVVVEIEDHGLGIEEAELQAANEVLREPPEFDAMALQSDARLGLFVVARLAARHAIGVELRSSPYGGTRAVVLLPMEITASSKEVRQLDPDRPPTQTLTRGRGAAGPPAPRSLSASGSIPVDELAQAPVEVSSAEVSARNSRSRDFGSPRPHPAQRRNGEQQPGGELPRRRPQGVLPAPGSAQPQLQRRGEISGSGSSPEVRENHQRSEPAWPAVDQAPPLSDEDARPPLPQRRRRANLAPQLDHDPVDQEEPPPVRSAEQVRGLLSAIQRGTHRGRSTSAPPRHPGVVDHGSDPHDDE
jgi:signal transduction histidine kinase